MTHEGRLVTHAARAHTTVADDEVEQRDQPVLRFRRAAGGRLVGDQIPLPEHNRLAVDPPDRLDHVHVLADDRRYVRGAREAPGQ
jgi:hypothetical protein